MRYRDQGISPSHVLNIRLTKREKKLIEKLQKKLNSKRTHHVSICELVRTALWEKINKPSLMGKRLKKKVDRPVRISVAVTDSFNRYIKLAAQESTESSESEFMRKIIFEYYESEI